MHHDHPLEIYDRHFMRNGPIMEEIKLLASCKVPVCTIYNLVNKKFRQKIRYADVYKVCKDLLQEQGQPTENHTELDAYIEALKEMKKQCKDTNYHFGGVYKNKQLIELDYVVVQNESMFMHSRSYSDIIYIDISNGTNKYDMGLILFSGINQERQNIVLAYALIREDIYSNYYNVFGTFFNKFLEENNPKTIITDVNYEMARALQSVIPANTIHLFCQWHVKRSIKDRFYKFNVKDATNAQKMIYEMMMQ